MKHTTCVIFASFHPCPEFISGKEKKDEKNSLSPFFVFS
jgi:hypothetical protein